MAFTRGPALSAPSGTYSEYVTVDGPGRWIHLSGALGFDADGNIITDDLYEESKAVFAAIAKTMAELGGSLEHIVKLDAYLTDLSRYEEFGRARSEAFGDKPPASATVEVSGLLLGATVEVGSVAFIPGS